jgi:RNA polymerase subunit RPABC4/transcription elongation factor Spt4
MKICLNCGDKLLDAAKKCPSCGTKDKGTFPLVDPNDREAIDKIIEGVQKSSKPANGFWAKAADQARQQQVAKTQAQQALKERIAQMDRDGTAYCPKCYSTSLTADKKGFGIGKAVVGAMVAGPIGLVAGNISAKKIRVTCLKCGHQFWAGGK